MAWCPSRTRSSLRKCQRSRTRMERNGMGSTTSMMNNPEKINIIFKVGIRLPETTSYLTFTGPLTE